MEPMSLREILGTRQDLMRYINGGDDDQDDSDQDDDGDGDEDSE